MAGKNRVGDIRSGESGIHGAVNQHGLSGDSELVRTLLQGRGGQRGWVKTTRESLDVGSLGVMLSVVLKASI